MNGCRHSQMNGRTGGRADGRDRRMDEYFNKPKISQKYKISYNHIT